MSCKKNKLKRKIKDVISNALKQSEQLLLYGECWTDRKGNVIPFKEWDKCKEQIRKGKYVSRNVI